MSRALIIELASAGITLKEAARRAGMSYYQFRMLRDMHLDVPWSMTPAQLRGLAAGRKPERYRKQPSPPSEGFLMGGI
jgi:hypothetical protein